ncbi:SDR family NAD(P)-dependent oxidoreductase [Salinisphaera sp. SPP-AMP-43]|uniref:SDR family NAD(P)-dependent oxidoreductase n=1 Tax=Salinisphaera sp. SPP-AMP-43 TaxID=3121288 RepID=UPI003C6E3670
MKRIFITGSTDGLGRAAAETLIDQGHAVLLHARSPERAAEIDDLVARSAGVVSGDLSRLEEVYDIADEINSLVRPDVIIHNAGVLSLPDRAPTPEGHATLMAVNLLAPYILTARIQRPKRLIYLSSSMQAGGPDQLDDLDWQKRAWNTTEAYSESKHYLAALALAVNERWSDVASHAVDPGWIATKMGGASAPGDLQSGQRTQVWLATQDDPAIQTGGYWRDCQRQNPPAMAADHDFQSRLLDTLAELTGERL